MVNLLTNILNPKPTLDPETGDELTLQLHLQTKIHNTENSIYTFES